ncbi:MAG: flavodoxin domain-containing protein [Planctomycetes bacterium]|nr:flavodoxin domain-containing protein [Planctomycetota bacterium]
MHYKIADGIYWVGVVDWDIRNFHGFTYTTSRGTTYNAYLIVDEKPTLIDTVPQQFYDEMLANIKEIIKPEEIAYLIANHGELDHSGSVVNILKAAPKAKLVCSTHCQGTLKRYFGSRLGRDSAVATQDYQFDPQVVKTGQSIKIGKRTLKFIEAPMLHWPDSMFTYLPAVALAMAGAPAEALASSEPPAKHGSAQAGDETDAILFPNDAFGQHIASSARFADQIDETVLMDEAAKYFANILAPFGSLIVKKIEEVQKMNIPINMIAPSHGLIWRSDSGVPPQAGRTHQRINPGKIIQSYLDWSKGETNGGVVIVYETMWGGTAKLARALADGITAEGVKVNIYQVPGTDRSDIIKEILLNRGLLVGSSTHNNDMLPNLAGLLYDLSGLRIKGKIGAAFGCFGWAGGAIEAIEEELKETTVEVVNALPGVKFSPAPEEIAKTVEFGKDFARRVKAKNGTSSQK